MLSAVFVCFPSFNLNFILSSIPGLSVSTNKTKPFGCVLFFTLESRLTGSGSSLANHGLQGKCSIAMFPVHYWNLHLNSKKSLYSFIGSQLSSQESQHRICHFLAKCPLRLVNMRSPSVWKNGSTRIADTYFCCPGASLSLHSLTFMWFQLFGLWGWWKHQFSVSGPFLWRLVLPTLQQLSPEKSRRPLCTNPS